MQPKDIHPLAGKTDTGSSPSGQVSRLLLVSSRKSWELLKTSQKFGAGRFIPPREGKMSHHLQWQPSCPIPAQTVKILTEW